MPLDLPAPEACVSDAALNRADLRLGFVTARSAFVGDDGIWMQGGVSRLVGELAKRCSRVTVAMSLADQKYPFLPDRLDMSPGDFIPLPRLSSVVRGFGQFPGCMRAIREVERRSDVVVAQLPFAAPLALVRPRTPRVYLLTADITANARHSPVYRGWRRLPARGLSMYIDYLQGRLFRAKHARVVSNGEALWDHYGRPRGRTVVSATLSADEIMSQSRRRPADAPFRVLYVGYLRYEKGIDILLDAFTRLLDELPTAELHLIGGADRENSELGAAFHERLAALARRGAVHLLGDRAFGPELFQYFADADVLALASRSEGTPRVLIEARAFGCPVVATRVGGIPTSVDHEVDGLLVPKEDSRELAAALLRIARDGALRSRLVEAGLRRARQTTVERYAQVIADEAWAAFMDGL